VQLRAIRGCGARRTTHRPLRGDLAPDPFVRARLRGARIGAMLARAVGRSPEEGAEHRAMGHWFGFAHVSSRREIEALARWCGLRAEWEPGEGYPHVTLTAA
jgi:hypothetical protein